MNSNFHLEDEKEFKVSDWAIRFLSDSWVQSKTIFFLYPFMCCNSNRSNWLATRGSTKIVHQITGQEAHKFKVLRYATNLCLSTFAKTCLQ